MKYGTAQRTTVWEAFAGLVITGTAGVSPAMSAQREQFDHTTASANVAGGRDARGPSEEVDKIKRGR